tara:strand:- start:6 stop:209 length:204 start_codon:yes stop_codon:yes gene_type:complete
MWRGVIVDILTTPELLVELLHCSSKWSLFKEDLQPHGLSFCFMAELLCIISLNQSLGARGVGSMKGQ